MSTHYPLNTQLRLHAPRTRTSDSLSLSHHSSCSLAMWNSHVSILHRSRRRREKRARRTCRLVGLPMEGAPRWPEHRYTGVRSRGHQEWEWGRRGVVSSSAQCSQFEFAHDTQLLLLANQCSMHGLSDCRSPSERVWLAACAVAA
eukprot:scaffold1441_cov120-Isochrysis_galbana.AAC.5